MLVRIISGAVLLILMGTAMVTGGWYLFGICAAISLIGMYELYNVFGIEKKLPGIVGYFGAVGLYITIWISDKNLMFMMITATMIALMAVFVFTFPKYRTEDIAFSYLGVIYVALMLSYIYQTRTMTNGVYFVWLVLICAWGSDSFAYLAGITLGKHKMSPNLSPKKSVEGAIGGVAGAAALGALLGWFVQTQTGNRYIVTFAVAAALGALVSIVGDLAASAVKRKFNIKDYGRIIPGHGGIMDRFDSVIFTAPVVYWVLYFMEN